MRFIEWNHEVQTLSPHAANQTFTESVRLTFRAIRDIQSGLVYFNAPTTGAEIHMPFGGMRASGNGHRELGAGAVEEFSETKSIFVSFPTRK